MRRFDGKRIAAILPFPEHFGGMALSSSQVIARALDELGCTTLEIDASPFFTRDQSAIDQIERRLSEFRPDAAFAFPNAGYGLACKTQKRGRWVNLPAEVLEIPFVVGWDDPLGQFSQDLLDPLPLTPEASQPGAAAKIRAGLASPSFYHQSWDFGHRDAVVELGWLSAERVHLRPLSATPPFVEHGRNGGVSRIDRDLLFAGNVYLAGVRSSPISRLPICEPIASACAAEKLQDLSRPNWRIFQEIVAQTPSEDRGAWRLDPDESFFWAFYRHIVWTELNNRVRTCVLASIPHRIDFFGCFTDPPSGGLLAAFPNIDYRGSVDYVRELPALYAGSRITVDVANALVQQSLPGKFYDCYAAGGFMLVEWKQDVVDRFGEPARLISYKTTDELAERIDYFLTHEKKRREIAAHLRERMHCEFTTAHWLAGSLGDLFGN